MGKELARVRSLSLGLARQALWWILTRALAAERARGVKRQRPRPAIWSTAW